jgi:hypothetical protein
VIRRARPALLALTLAGAASGCDHPPLFEALTTPPPFTQAALCDRCDEGDGEMSITLTQGVALAFACYDGVTFDPCSHVEASLADPTVAALYTGYLDTLAEATSNEALTGIDGDSAESVLVVVGSKVGQTTLSYASASGDVTFDVSVVAP